MTKNILLAATAASVMAFAGAASAHTLTFRAAGGGISAADIPAIPAGGTPGTYAYKLAAEAKAVTPSFATFNLVDTLTAGASLPSGNTILTITLTNGTWGTGGLVPANINATGIANCGTFTATPSAGGAVGGTTATFIISNSLAGCGSFNLDLPVAPNATGSVSVTTTLATEAGTPIDGLNASRTIVTRPSAFDVDIDGVIGSGALANTFATLLQTPVYTQFRNGAGTGGHNGAGETTTVGQLGTIKLTVDVNAFSDLSKTFVDPADVMDAGVVVNGSFTSFDGTGGDVTLGGGSAKTAPNTLTGSVATFATSNALGAAMIAAPLAFIVDRETANVTIPASQYSAVVSYRLNPAIYNQEGPVVGSLETIERDGTNVIFPWMNSDSISASRGTTNLIRLANVSGTNTGPVYVQVLNAAASPSSYVALTEPTQIFPSIVARSERLITTADLTTAVGDFGRGDVQISIEARPEQITARRFATLANGSITEFESGTVANDQAAGEAGTALNYIP